VNKREKKKWLRLISYETFGANNEILRDKGTCCTIGRTLGQSQENMSIQVLATELEFKGGKL
jgi:hypothetical protein